jgi:protein-disulfide isomerase
MRLSRFTSWRRVLLPALGLAALIALGLTLRPDSPGHVPFDLPGYGHEKGKSNAPIVLIEFADFGCSACAKFARETWPQIERDWIATGRARIRMIPFDLLRTGATAARAAECAAQQNAFWPMHDLLYARQKEWLARRGQEATFAKWAAELGLNAARFRACAAHPRTAEQLERNTQLARTHGVPGTPAFVVNGRPVVGALPYSTFLTLLEAATQPSTIGK